MKIQFLLFLLIFQNVSFGQNQNVKNWNNLRLELIHRTEIVDSIYKETSEDAYPKDREAMKTDNEMLKIALKNNKFNTNAIRQIYKKNRFLNKSLDQVLLSLQLNMEVINKKALPLYESLIDVEKKINILVKKYNLQCEEGNSSNLKFPLTRNESPTLVKY